jgi:hypothetical protein
MHDDLSPSELQLQLGLASAGDAAAFLDELCAVCEDLREHAHDVPPRPIPHSS